MHWSVLNQRRSPSRCPGPTANVEESKIRRFEGEAKADSDLAWRCFGTQTRSDSGRVVFRIVGSLNCAKRSPARDTRAPTRISCSGTTSLLSSILRFFDSSTFAVGACTAARVAITPTHRMTRVANSAVLLGIVINWVRVHRRTQLARLQQTPKCQMEAACRCQTKRSKGSRT